MLMSAIKILEQPRRHRILYSYVRSMYALCLRGMIMNASLINCQWLQKGIAHWEKFARRFYNSTISSLNQRNTEGFSDQYCLKNIFHDANLILKTFAFICIYLIFFFFVKLDRFLRQVPILLGQYCIQNRNRIWSESI